MSRSQMLVAVASQAKPVCIGDGQLAEIEEEIKKIHEEIELCPEVEQGIRKTLIATKDSLGSDLRKLMAIQEWGGPVRVIDLPEALRWRNGFGLPRLAIFAASGALSSIVFRYICDLRFFVRRRNEKCFLVNREPSWLSGYGCFADLESRFLEEGKKTKIHDLEHCFDNHFQKDFHVTATFADALSTETRLAIKRAGKLFSELYLLAERPEGRMSVEIREENPLLVARLEGAFFLLDQTDFPLPKKPDEAPPKKEPVKLDEKSMPKESSQSAPPNRVVRALVAPHVPV